VEPGSGSEFTVHGLTPERVGDVAFAGGIRLHHLAPARASLEQAFMELTAGSVEYQAGAADTGRQPAHSGTESLT
jgi:ABC-2 type transport system ATP-binding protein